MSSRLTVQEALGPVRELDLSGPVTSLGRAADNDVILADARVSSHHGRLFLRDGTCFYEDLGSRNGSLIRSATRREVVPPHAPLPLGPRDELLLGDRDAPVILRVIVEGGAASEAHSGGTVIARRALAEGSQALRQIDSATLRALFELLHDLSGRSDPSEVMTGISESLFDRFAGLQSVRVLARGPASDPGDADFRVVFSRGQESSDLDADLDPELLREAAEQERVLIYAPGAAQNPSPSQGLAAWVPLRAGSTLVGLLHLQRSGQPFSRDDGAWLAILGFHMGASLGSARRFQRLLRVEGELRSENVSLKAVASLSRPILGRSPKLQEALTLLRKAAPTPVTVLILGETGTGKELAALYLHAHSPRHGGVFNAVNCAALPSQLLESELFGHRRGSFTGALRDRAGLFEVAQGGTVFLDEIGEMSPELQRKLLRVLQEKEVRPVGATRPLKVDVRVIAATNRKLSEEVSSGRFREDLYYRLSVFPVELPPLRLRTGDIALLAEHFRESFCAQHGRWIPGFSSESMELLLRYRWPGNIRELQHAVERAVILSDDGQSIRVEQLSPIITGCDPDPNDPGELPRGALKGVMAVLEEQFVRRCLEEQGGNRTRAAQELGISRQALQVKLARWRDRDGA